jgi:aspartokinase-like uncharacterized kinase
MSRFRWEAVVKLGGSVGRRRGRLEPLLRHLAQVARRAPILVVPGGGRLADGVRREMRRLRLSQEGAHGMALLAMDQFGLALVDREPSARPVTTFVQARRAARAGRLPVLLASRLAGRAPGLEKSFRLTSDSIAAWIARRSGARRLVLIKSVPDLSLEISGSVAARRAARAGLVDPLFSGFAHPALEIRLLGVRRALTWEPRSDASRHDVAKTGTRRRRRRARRGTAPGAARRAGHRVHRRRARRGRR